MIEGLAAAHHVVVATEVAFLLATEEHRTACEAEEEECLWEEATMSFTPYVVCSEVGIRTTKVIQNAGPGFVLA